MSYLKCSFKINNEEILNLQENEITEQTLEYISDVVSSHLKDVHVSIGLNNRIDKNKYGLYVIRNLIKLYKLQMFAYNQDNVYLNFKTTIGGEVRFVLHHDEKEHSFLLVFTEEDVRGEELLNG